MHSVIKVAISGKTLLYNNTLTDEECTSLQKLADSILLSNFTDADIKAQFIREAQNNLGVSLEPVTISHVIRIR